MSETVNFTAMKDGTREEYEYRGNNSQQRE
jgi:hypothetical protein